MARKSSSSTRSSSRSSSSRSSGRRKPNPLLTLLGAIVIAVTAYCGTNGLDLDSPPATTAPSTRVITPTTAPATTVAPTAVTSSGLQTFTIGTQGFGAQKGFWQVFFTNPSGSSDRSTYRGGLDEILAAAIGTVTRTLDIAAFEWNSPALTTAVADAARRGVRVRMVVDDEHTMQDTDTTIQTVISAGANVVDDERSALMHNKFMILDSTTVWTGSWNYTVNDTYRNNNNALALRSRNAVAIYQAEFDEMFANGSFGPRSTRGANQTFTQDGTPVQIYFAAEDDVVGALRTTLSGATRSIRFMSFSFTLEDVGQVLLDRAAAGVSVTGIFETTGSETRFSELTPLFCAGLDARQDGGPFVLHHKVFIVDERIVIAGSFNFSAGARDSNDENMFIITDPDLAAQYIAEFNRRFAQARRPLNLTCS